ncbi:MAG: Sir2 silent information regulator family NAD-dependent deacetylase [Bacteroidales bacterium]|nr:Sir2 silent information regulator family NAD-dependent deacetylase [Bacteroidales bacterium]
MTSTASYSERISFLRQAVQEADHIIIGAGSGLTTAAGIDYAGDDFRREFAPWIERYVFTDLYTSSFYPFETPEEYWAYWAKHIWFSRYRTGATELYKTLLHRFPEAFIVTTNVDAQFELAGFPTERIFATQGDYCWFQPASGSPKTLVDNREWVFSVLPHIHDCRIPTEMIPTMPDGSPASLNLRVDDTFVEDFHWHQQARRYTDFVQRASQDNLLLLEFGIGYNTPGIIRLPFEQMAQRFPHTTLVRFNRDNPEPYIEDMPRFAAFTEDIATVINLL